MAFFTCMIVTAMPAFPSEVQERSSAENKAASVPADRPCSFDEKIHKISVEEVSEKLKGFDKGDPLFYTLLSIISDSDKDTCYYVEGKDLQKTFLNKAMLDLSDTKVSNGRTLYKTRAPVNEIKWVSAKISGGDIKASSRLRNRFVKHILGSRIIGIPKTLDFTISASFAVRPEADAQRNEDEYDVFISYENSEEPFVSDLFTFLTGLTSHEMHVKKADKKPNRRKAYKTLRHLYERGLVKIHQKKNGNGVF